MVSRLWYHWWHSGTNLVHLPTCITLKIDVYKYILWNKYGLRSYLVWGKFNVVKSDVSLLSLCLWYLNTCFCEQWYIICKETIDSIYCRIPLWTNDFGFFQYMIETLGTEEHMKHWTTFSSLCCILQCLKAFHSGCSNGLTKSCSPLVWSSINNYLLHCLKYFFVSH